ASGSCRSPGPPASPCYPPWPCTLELPVPGNGSQRHTLTPDPSPRGRREKGRLTSPVLALDVAAGVCATPAAFVLFSASHRSSSCRLTSTAGREALHLAPITGPPSKGPSCS